MKGRQIVSTLSAIVIMLFITSIHAEEPPIKNARHKYTLQVSGQDGAPVENATVTFVLQPASGEPLAPIRKATISNGTTAAYVSVPAIHGAHSTENKFTSYLDYTIEKEGYAPQKGSLLISSNEELSFKTKKVSLMDLKTIRTVEYFDPADFFAQDFPDSREGMVIKEQLMAVLDSLLLQGYLSEISLEPHSMQLTDFESKQYLSFRFTATQNIKRENLTNTLLSKIVFEQMVSKILKPLAKINNRGLFYGYSLTFINSLQSIDAPEIPVKKVACYFFIPASIARKYNNNSISAQDCIDASTLYVDNEKISLLLE